MNIEILVDSITEAFELPRLQRLFELERLFIQSKAADWLPLNWGGNVLYRNAKMTGFLACECLNSVNAFRFMTELASTVKNEKTYIPTIGSIGIHIFRLGIYFA